MILVRNILEAINFSSQKAKDSYKRDVGTITTNAKKLGAFNNPQGRQAVSNAIKSTTQLHKMVN